MNEQPRISVVIPTFNRAGMVCDCVKSVLDTEYPNLEVIVVDDCSPDDTQSRIAERFAGDGRVKYVKNERNSLSAHSRNNGAAHASGDYILFIDDDNIGHKDILDELLAAFRRHPDAGYIAPLTGNFDKGRLRVWTIGSYFNSWTSTPADVRPLPEFVEDVPQGTVDFPTKYSPNAFMVSREVFDAVGGATSIWE